MEVQIGSWCPFSSSMPCLGLGSEGDRTRRTQHAHSFESHAAAPRFVEVVCPDVCFTHGRRALRSSRPKHVKMHALTSAMVCWLCRVFPSVCLYVCVNVCVHVCAHVAALRCCLPAFCWSYLAWVVCRLLLLVFLPCALAVWPRYIHLRVLYCLFSRTDGRLSPRIGPCCETSHIMCQPLSEGVAWRAGSHGASRAACARLGLRVRIARHAQLAHGAQRASSEFELLLHLRGFLVLRIVV